MYTVKAKGRARLFKSDLLEMGTKTNPIAVLAIYIPMVSVLVWYFYSHVHPTFITLVAMYFAGLFSWTFFEYILHRYVFHFVNEQKWAQRFHYMIHGVHHEYPKDKLRLVMPPMASLAIAVLFFFLFNMLLGKFVSVFFGGFITGYICYDMIHYTLHAFRQPKNGLKFYWEYHNIHHFRHHDKAYGVSSPLWDIVFGTFPKKG